MPEAVSARPPRKGPTRRYFIPLKVRSCCVLSAARAAAASAFFLADDAFCATADNEKIRMRNRPMRWQPEDRLGVNMGLRSPMEFLKPAILIFLLADGKGRKWS